MGLDLSAVAAIDQQGYPLLRPEIAASLPYAAIFTESHDSEVIRLQVPKTLAYRRGMRTIATLLGCEATAEAIAAQRSELGWDALGAKCLAAARLEALLLDDSFLPEAALPLGDHQSLVPTHRVLQVERLAEALLPQVTQLEVFLEWFRSELDPPPAGVVAFKSSALQQGGIVEGAEIDQAAVGFDEVQYSMATHEPEEAPMNRARLDPHLNSFLLAQALEIAAKYSLPVQLQAGLGDVTQAPQLANPLSLRPLLETRAYRRVSLVLVTPHPFLQAASSLAAAYPQVYIEYGHTASVSAAGAGRALKTLLERCPTTKIVYGSGARFLPDAFYLAATAGRQALAQVLEDAVADGDLTGQDAEGIAIAILRGNAQRLYRVTSVS
ncbi:MAG: amidohydrolase family protein [Elainellaceae cyanobacterium]